MVDLAAADGVLAQAVKPVALAGSRTLPVLPTLASMVPGSGLRRGSVVSVMGSTSLALALAAAPSAAGAWVAAVGAPDLGAEAAAELGVALARFALVPDPGAQWTAVVAALLDGVELVLARPPAHLRQGEARRLAARARERGSVIVAFGRPWPEGADVRLTVTGRTPTGLGEGEGRLTSVALDVTTDGRGGAARATRRRWALAG